MSGNSYKVLFLASFFLFSCFLAQVHGKRQGDVLADLYKTKFSGNNPRLIDTSPFKVLDVSAPTVNDNVLEGDSDGGLTMKKEGDRIVRLPGQPRVNFSQYGGYVTVDKVAGRAFYYYFVEAQKSKESLPLLLWLNGGPGCSSLGYGAMEELGPFRVHSDGKTLFTNRYSWNKAANVLFLESPAGVGFSYSNRTSDYAKSGDSMTAADNYLFLLNWLERFPEYKNREFYLSGESYAGHYVPQLAQTILHHNKKANRTIINLKGMIIGNAAINDQTDNLGMFDFFGTHALTSQENLHQIHKHCSFVPHGNTTVECADATIEANANVLKLDIYNIYGPLCSDVGNKLTAKPKRASVLNFDPCSTDYVHAYLNRPDVQEAMHANVTKLNYTWDSCGDLNWIDSPSSTVDLLQEFLATGLRLWIYSGDTDGRVPVTSTQYALTAMKLPTKTLWHPWYHKGEVGGYTQVYEGNLTFATVRGAGHEVPSYQPARALSLISHFLHGTPLPGRMGYW